MLQLTAPGSRLVDYERLEESEAEAHAPDDGAFAGEQRSPWPRIGLPSSAWPCLTTPPRTWRPLGQRPSGAVREPAHGQQQRCWVQAGLHVVRLSSPRLATLRPVTEDHLSSLTNGPNVRAGDWFQSYLDFSRQLGPSDGPGPSSAQAVLVGRLDQGNFYMPLLVATRLLERAGAGVNAPNLHGIDPCLSSFRA